MKTINIIGAGNVVYHLLQALNKSSQYKIQNIAVRSLEKALDFIPEELIVTNINQLKKTDITLISVTDNAIEQISDNIPYKDSLVVHTSGTTALEILNDKNRRGVFYPLQTFSKNKEISFKEVPLCLEAENENDLNDLKKLADELSENVYELSSQQRKSLHVAAVFVSNFVNHMYYIGNEICMANNIPFNILKPLIKETANKINYLSPEEAQTGPAVRFDTKTTDAHEAFLINETYKEIYKLITKSIQKNV
ncbi:Predicted oxidoreductase, contains short-chain dehydrogenase (SDR) and DUF2520 domains [Paenimyroides aquimaris]|uniref:Predicted oxidoreductase, contains short-chain dehydrogenase (SDR) and DUF2520 domains n=1 Tax=Paenimyroides marinum TaxID=1159016 RepID=A0A1H6M4Z9_9FLAO|nr:Rossmann-like and DUF2520 domain-containing protein [Paenimyroides aquimaris]SEH92651.1 Predicted oxidoreductase, contains short-chain dehydrogenase (SDR) and DUF2520 domains [Paenimyroides aquimaris]